MRIAVDARPLRHPRTGIGRYTLELMSRMSAAGEHEWLLYGGPTPPVSIKYARHRPLPGPRSMAAITSQVWFPSWIEADRAVAFWSPRHHLPLGSAVPMAVTIHDVVWRRAARSMALFGWLTEALLMPASIRKATSIICVSHATADDLAHLYPGTRAKTTVIHEATGVRESDYRGPTTPEPYLLFVGTREPRKNLSRLLVAFSRNASLSDHALVIAGGRGWRGRGLAAEVARLDLGDRVSMIEDPDDRALASLYRHCDAVLLPSLYEGFGLPLVEAMAFGKPLLTSNRSAMPEIAGDAAVLIDPESVRDLSRGLARIMTDHELRERLGRASGRRGRSFSWDLAAAETLRVIESVTGA